MAWVVALYQEMCTYCECAELWKNLQSMICCPQLPATIHKPRQSNLLPLLSACMHAQGFWHLGLRSAIENLMADPDHCAARGTDRHRDQRNTLYGSLAVQDIDRKLGVQATKANQTGSRLNPVFYRHNSLYMIGEDACQPYNNCPHSTNMVFLK